MLHLPRSRVEGEFPSANHTAARTAARIAARIAASVGPRRIRTSLEFTSETAYTDRVVRHDRNGCSLRVDIT